MKYKISELTDYYINRYDLQEKGISDNPNAEIQAQFKRNISQQITRLLKQKHFESTTLYEAIKPKKGPRKIEIETFEEHCLKDFAAYIEGRYTYDSAALEHDMEISNARKDKDYWKKVTTELQENTNKAYESGYIPGKSSEEDLYIDHTSEEEIIKRGCQMMIQAIYSLYFEDFKWDKLERDTHLNDLIDDNYGAQNKPEQIKAYYNQEDYRNYIGDQKNKSPKK